MSPKIVFVDLDGVLCDFVGGVLKLHGLEMPNFNGAYDISDVLGMSVNKFWGAINEKDDFWATLEKTADSDEILQILEKSFGTSNIFFLSSPQNNSACYKGKIEWVIKNYSAYKKRLILTGHKHLLASKGRYLVDDSEVNCAKFSSRGGKSFLYGRAWNRSYKGLKELRML